MKKVLSTLLVLALAMGSMAVTANAAELENLTDAMTKILTEALDLSPERIYVRYEEVAYWGWNGKNF